MKVTLLDCTPEPERVVAMAARLCYSASTAAELKDKMGEEQVAALIGKIVAMGHASVLEHASFTFGVDGVSRALTHQLVRHRVASYSQQSQRYVSAHDFATVMPPTIKGNPLAELKFNAVMEQVKIAYDDLVALGVPKEDARYLLPNAVETKIVVTMNARELRHFFNVRCCHRAQWEIRELAGAMLAEAKRVAPLLFRNAGASCVESGRCPEGAMTCGKLAEMLALREP